MGSSFAASVLFFGWLNFRISVPRDSGTVAADDDASTASQGGGCTRRHTCFVVCACVRTYVCNCVCQKAGGKAEVCAARGTDSHTGGAGAGAAAGTDADGTITFSVEEAVKRLRRMGKPITLFGETHKDRLKRLHKLEDVAHDDLALGEGHEIVRWTRAAALCWCACCVCVCFPGVTFLSLPPPRPPPPLLYRATRSSNKTKRSWQRRMTTMQTQQRSENGEKSQNMKGRRC